MRVKNAFIVFLLSLSIVIGGLPSSNLIVWAGESYDEVIAIVHTNDVHGHIEVEPYVKGLANSLKKSVSQQVETDCMKREQRR